MKIITILLAALFPFLHTTSYEVQITDCRKDHIEAVSEGSKLQLSLFNIHLKDENAWASTCALLEESDTVTMEIDPSTQIRDTLSVYLFLDGKLLQEELLRQNLAYILIHNPEYTYEKQMETAAQATTQTAAKPVLQKEEHRYPLQGPLYLGGFFIIWIGMLLYALHRKKGHSKPPEV